MIELKQLTEDRMIELKQLTEEEAAELIIEVEMMIEAIKNGEIDGEYFEF